MSAGVLSLAIALAGTGAAPSSTLDLDHRRWTGILGECVQGGLVNYDQLHRSGPSQVDAYLQELVAVRPEALASFAKPDRLAYWLNAYNALVVKVVLDHYPLQSIRALGQEPFAVFREPRPPFKLSLDQIEALLRREGDPRVYFALVCASRSCPALRAYRGAALDRQLDQAARQFIRDRNRNRFDPVTRTLFLSRLFDWYRADFERPDATLAGYVARYEDEATSRAIRAGPVALQFIEYDWSLNSP
jgi:hypothetical protein